MDVSRLVSQDSVPQLALQFIGAIVASSLLYRLLNFVYLYFLRPSKLKEYLIDPKSPTASKSQIASESSETKSWALVTGASDGIGKATAHQLAQAGFNVVLHGRNPTKLDVVLKGLQKSNPRTQFRVLVCNASISHGMKSAISSMADELNALPGPLTLLINNVGGTSPTPQVFTPLRKLEHKEVEGLVSLNALFAVQLTRALLPNILARNADQGIKVAIVNIGSAAQMGTPMQSVYSGAKSFMRIFTYALAREMHMEGHAGISCMYAVVAHVTNAGPFTGPPTLFTPTAETMAHSLLDSVGCGRIEMAPYWGHAMQVASASFMPNWLLTSVLINELRKDIELEESKAKKT